MPGDAESPSPLGDDALSDLLRRAADEAGFGITITLTDHEPYRSLHVNRRAEEILGRSAAELNEMGGPLAAVAPEALPALLERRERRLRGETIPEVFETTLLRGNGERVPVQIALGHVSIAGRRTTIAFLLDLTTRRQAESALRESEERFRTVVQNAPDGVAILRGPLVMYLNERAARLLGLAQPDQGYGRRITDFLHPEDVAAAEQRIKKLIQSGKPPNEPHEYRSRSADGRELTVEISSIPIELNQSRAVLAFARDVTERKAIQARLAQAERLSALGVLSAGVAHEINNPLAYVLLNLEFLERELTKPDPDANPGTLLERVRQARHGAERVAAIVRDLKTFSRSDGWARGPVSLERVLDAVVRIAHAETSKRARVVTRYAEVPPVLGNAQRLEQVFSNLVVNAAQAIPEGAPETHRITIALGREGETVQVTVEDDGAGMAPDVLDRIFDPFFTTKPPGVGTGLGLPICRSILRAHEGDLAVESTPGVGSTFTVTLPAWLGDHASEPAEPDEPPPETARGRVLVVDDEAAVGRTLSLVLEPEYTVTVVTSGVEALGALRRAREGAPFDAVLCDLAMPGMSGRDLFRTVSDEIPGIESRFIFMSGGYAQNGPDEFIEARGNRTFEKPFDLNEVRRALREVIQTRHPGTG